MTELRRVNLVAVLLAVLLAFGMLKQGFAQPVNAPPGTVCITPQFWCYATKPGPPGAPCACQTARGWVAGTLR